MSLRGKFLYSHIFSYFSLINYTQRILPWNKWIVHWGMNISDWTNRLLRILPISSRNTGGAHFLSVPWYSVTSRRPLLQHPPLPQLEYTLKFSTWIPRGAWRCLRRSSQVTELTEDRGSAEGGRQTRLHSWVLHLVNYSQTASSCVPTVHFQMVLLPNTRSLELIKKLK